MIHGCCFELGWSIFPLRTLKTLNGSNFTRSALSKGSEHFFFTSFKDKKGFFEKLV